MAMDVMPWLWFMVSAVVGIAVWGFLLWLAWMLVRSIRGVHVELTRIREHLTGSGSRERPGTL